MKNKTERTCPKCGHIFKPMTNEQWEVALLEHLTLSRRHNFMPLEEAQKYLPHSL